MSESPLLKKCYLLPCDLAAGYPDATCTVNLIFQMILISSIVCRVTQIYLHLLCYYIYLLLFYMIVSGDWTLYCPRRHRSCRIAELDTLNKSLSNADFWAKISTDHNTYI